MSVEAPTCANCDIALPKNGGYSHMGESAQCARCFRLRWPGEALRTLAEYAATKLLNAAKGSRR